MDIIRWAEARKIIPNSTSHAQFLKLTEELGESISALVKGNRAELQDGIGDMMVVMIIICALEDIDLTACVELAYDEIKNRKGTMSKDGIFVKEE